VVRIGPSILPLNMRTGIFHKLGAWWQLRVAHLLRSSIIVSAHWVAGV
jgi:hypothetical protein